ncbi:MAG: hypothetical protein LAP38_12845 [Acidobacteriia bacterium]|nr:hypothetical protein [Terriglobia bacterium]
MSQPNHTNTSAASAGLTGNSTWHRVAVLFTAACLVLLAFLYSFFMDRADEFDELVLANPIHTYLYGPRMTYPAHGQPDYMVVHPPTHYAVLANLMRAGLDLFHAAGLPIFLLFLLAVVLLVTGGFSFEIKLALLFGLYTGIFVWGHFRDVRPDLHVAAAWLCGLVSLEAARLSRWSTWRLTLGAFLVTYASGLHYPACFAFLSGVVYAIWCVRDLGWRRGWIRVAAMSAASAVFALPFFSWFVVPLWREILDFVRIVGKQTFVSPWKLHLETYAYWWNHPELPGAFHAWRNRPLIALLTAPIFAWRIPAAIVGPAVLVWFKTARGMALAAAPQLAFLLFFVGGQGKNYTNTGYYVPEITIYLTGLVTAILILAGRLLGRWTANRSKAPGALLPAFLITAAALTQVPNSMAQRFALTPRLGYEDLLRAAGHEILGPGASVASQSPTMWYHSGAEHYYFLNSDLMYPGDISGIDLPQYFSHFDAIGIAPDNSGITWNRQRKSETEWYVDGLLKLRGFVIAGGNLSYLLAGAQPSHAVMGFCYDYQHKRLWRFTEGQPANAVLVLFHGPASKIAFEPALNDTTWGYQSFRMAGEKPATRGDEILQASVIPVEHYAAASAALQKYHVVEQFRGRVEAVSIASMFDSIDRGKWPLDLPRTLPELEALVASPAGPAMLPTYSALVPQAEVSPDRIRVSASKLQWELVARSNPMALEPGVSYRVSFQLGISHGGVAVNVMSPDLRQFQFQLQRRYPQKTWPESFVFTPKDSAGVLTFGALNERPGRSSFELRGLKIERVVVK